MAWRRAASSSATIGLKHMPKIVMVTAFGREDIRTQAEEIGIDGFLLKPVSASLLHDTLLTCSGVAEQEGRSRHERRVLFEAQRDPDSAGRRQRNKPAGGD